MLSLAAPVTIRGAWRPWLETEEAGKMIDTKLVDQRPATLHPIRCKRWKRRLYELLETAADRCEDVATIIEAVVLENS